jgi:acyl carrier protein
MISETTLVELLADVLFIDHEEIPTQNPIQELPGWDSVNALRLLLLLEAELSVKISPTLFAKPLSVTGLCEALGPAGAR